MADSISITLESRTAFGKKNKALRRTGRVPVHMYGLTSEPLPLQAEILLLRETLAKAGGTTPVTVKVKGGEESVTLIREVRRHPVSGELLHVDFMRVDVQQEVEADVPIALINEDRAPGTRGGAGVVTQGVYELTIRARPFDIPHEIQVDCIVLVDLQAEIRAKELALPAGVSLVSDPDTRIAWIEPPRVTVEETPAAAEGEEAAEAPAEGEEKKEE
jgi:large subunit ribosomal protein L25